MIRRRGQEPKEEDSSSDEEDAFAALSKKRGAKRSKPSIESSSNHHNHDPAPKISSIEKPKESVKSVATSTNAMVLPGSVTSSMKRHHKPNDMRKAKMDALLEELAAEQIHRPIEKKSRSQRFVPEKKGSYVDPAEEHLTTNIFVGNLDPSLTEHEVRSLFSKFGEVYSMKIMWPRTLAERSRNRLTGFVCFMNRADAEAAMEECNEADPFNVGRLIMLRWGKSVKISDHSGSFSEHIRVELPVGLERFHFISRVAKFVADNGSKAESRLKDKEFANPAFRFLTFNGSRPEQRREHLFYRWRVYSFAHGDSYSEWRTKPFQMFEPHGRTWIPPPISKKPADASKQKDQKDDSNDGAFMTGRQIERARGGGRKGDRAGAVEGRAVLSKSELERFDTLIRKQLTVSRNTICEAMAFCFEKSASAREIAEMLRDSLVEEAPRLSIDAKTARLYLLSDILFNSQQPGVRNAFMYRDAIEKMAAEVFTSLGRYNSGDGRMTMNKLRMAVKSVLGAWTEWSVYNPTFMDELEARFEGQEIKKEVVEIVEKADEPEVEDETKPEPVEVITTAPQGGWTMLSEDAKSDAAKRKKRKKAKAKKSDEILNALDSDDKVSPQTNGEKTRSGKFGNSPVEMDGSPIDANDIDGEPMDYENDDGEIAEDEGKEDDNQSEATEYDELDGAPLTDSDLDGEPLEYFPGFGKDDQVPLAPGDGVETNKDDIDGEAIDGEALEDEDTKGDSTG
ncbi:unnamed protein product [Cylindrotheca closterium]|uniref:U2 snRNP-associated SURP motif-containing protein n=1 Tax=Cylindrotheca closterium TaxID=2856 RepID=A0AAD2GAS4_9STRA|nr:unnamed protein product [Cylindrotheca closterium]